MLKNNIKFESNEKGIYYNSYFEFYGKKRRIKILIYKTIINIDCGYNYWHGITSYKKLNEVLKHFHDDRKREVWRDMNFAERVTYATMKEYEEHDTTEVIEGVVGMLEKSISNNLNKLANSVSNKNY